MKIIWILWAFFFVASCSWASPNGSKKVTVTLFEWKFSSVARECQEFLGPMGYGYVEISPAQEHIQGFQWWTSYQPVSYQLLSRLGSPQEFSQMIKTCHEAGVKIIADVVLNHMSNRLEGIGTGGTRFTKYNYPGLYQLNDFHTCHDPITNYQSREQVQSCELDSLADLDTGSKKVQEQIVAYLKRLAAYGVDGFRIDAAKHISSADLQAIKRQLPNSIYWVQEVIYGEGEPIHPKEYLSLGDVDEFRYAWDLKRIFLTEKLTYLKTFGEQWGYLPQHYARVFIDNWDTERNNSTLNYKNEATYTLAYVFMLTYPYGEPNIFSGYEFEDINSGPPNQGEVRQCYQDKWKCQHRWPQIATLIHFHNEIKDAPVSWWWSNDNNAIAYARGNKGLVVINHELNTLYQTFQTPLVDGIYCDLQHGYLNKDNKCVGQSYLISQGRFTVQVSANDAVVLWPCN